MNVLKKINCFLNPVFFSYLIGGILSSLLIGYALSSILLVLFVLTSILYTLINKKNITLNLNLIFPVSLYCIFILSLFWSVDIQNTIKGLGRTVVLALVPLAFILIPVFTKRNLDLVFSIFTKTNVLLGLFFLFNAVIKYFSSKDSVVFTYHELVSVLDLNAIYVSFFFLFNFVYLLQKKNKKTWEKWSMFILFSLVFLLSSKMAIFCLLVLIAVYSVFFTNTRIVFVKNKFLIVLFILLTSLISGKVIERFLSESKSDVHEVFFIQQVNHTYPWTGTTIRALQLRFLFDQIKEDNILFNGFGLFASRENLTKRHIKLGTYPSYHDYNYHNMYAQMISELGLLGLSVLIVMLISNCYKSIKNRTFLFLSFSIIMLFWFFSESVLWVQRGLFFFIIFHCLLNRTKF